MDELSDSIDQLESRIDQLESTIEGLPERRENRESVSRRGAVAGLLGGAALTAGCLGGGSPVPDGGHSAGEGDANPGNAGTSAVSGDGVPSGAAMSPILSAADAAVPSPADGLTGIQEAVSGEGDALVVLESGATYEGSETITIDATPVEEEGRNVTVLAYGAELRYTGGGRAVEMVKSNGENRGQHQWIGGRIVGPGSDRRDSVAFTVIDSARAVVEPQEIYHFGELVQLRNEEVWTEYPQVGGFRAIDFNTGIRFMSSDVTGGDGTSSFRGAVIHDVYAKDPNDRFLIEMDESAGVYASTIHEIHSYVVDPDQATLHAQGWMPGTKIDKFRVETAGSDSPGVGILAENIAKPPTQITNIATSGTAKPLQNETDHELLGIRPTVNAP
jgi:hypothetical protein